MAATDWFGNCYRQGFKNLGATPMVGTFDAWRLARYWKDAGAEVVFMNAIFKSYTLYPTSISVQDPFLKGRDLVQEFCEACAREGLRPGAYIQPQHLWPFMDGHPEWCQTRTDGTLYGSVLQDYDAPVYREACYNSPYTDQIEALIRECFTRYPFEAAFYDETYTREGLCHCRFCKERFKTETGLALPKQNDWSDPLFRRAVQFKYATFRRGILRCVEAARAARPDLAIVLNNVSTTCHWCACHGEELTEALDYSCSESVVGSAHALERLGYAHDTVAPLAAYHLGLLRGKSRRNRKVQAYNYVVDTSQARMDIDLRLELLSSAAYGGLPAIQGEQPAVKDIFAYFKRCEPYLTDTRPVPYAAIVASEASGDYWADEARWNYHGDLKGMFNALFDLRAPTEFVSGRALEAGELDGVAVLVLSDVVYLSPRQADVVREFVARGGGLIATCRSSLIGENAKPLPTFALADVLGVDAAGDLYSERRGHLLFEPAPWVAEVIQRSWDPAAGDLHAEDNPWFPEHGEFLFDPAQPVKLRPGARSAARYLPMGPGDGQCTKEPEKPEWPGIVENTFGKGKTVYVSQRFGETYGRLPFPVWRRVMERALAYVAPRPPPIEVKAPLSVSVALWEQPQAKGRWVIHLLNDLDVTGRPAARGYGGLKTGKTGARPREGVLPVDGVEVMVRKPGATHAYAPLTGKPFATEGRGDGLLIRVGRVEQHALVVVE